MLRNALLPFGLAGRKRKSVEFVPPLRYSFRDNAPKYPAATFPPFHFDFRVTASPMPVDPRTKRRVIGRNLIFAGYSHVTIALLAGDIYWRKQFCSLKCSFVPGREVVEFYLKSDSRYVTMKIQPSPLCPFFYSHFSVK